ncbi:MAG: ATP-dependent RNA helicase HrpA [Thermochromatium sp.]
MEQPTDQDIAGCLIRDRHSLRSRLRHLRRRARANEPIDAELAELWACIQASQSVVAQRQALVPQLEYPPELPVSERRDEIAALIEHHQVIVLCGETGSGKSTQLPKLCLELGRGRFGRIGHTQPRRIAARTLASRIAQELGVEIGSLVGYKVRFHDRVRPETAIKLMTDGILLAEIQQDRWLTEYDTLIIDEAHERGLNIDFLLGYLKQLLPRRPDLKLIVTSATIDPERFARHFANGQHRPAPILEISGRTYPVEVRYRPPEDEHAAECDESMQRAISEAVAELAQAGPGDVLVFLSGEREIRTTTETLRQHHPPSTEILPLFARQGPQEQARLFQPHGTRRVILATNVAETSLTVPGIRYVVDTGFARISRYNHRTQVQRLPVERISQASANQRQGRCGRVACGICIRLYSEDNFRARAAFTEPEIARTNLAAVILQMKRLGLGAIEHFPFIDRPDPRLINDGYRTLEELGALDKQGELTALGHQLARLPVDPRIGRMLLAAHENQCLAEVLVIAAALSVQDPRERPHDKRQDADAIHASFNHPESDFITFLNLWHFLERERHQRSRNQFIKLCQRHFLSWNRVQEWRDIHAQLREQMLEMGFKESAANASQAPSLDANAYEKIHRALLTGLLSHIGYREGEREFQGARNSRFLIHPSSTLFAKPPKWVMVAERVETTRQYGRIAAAIQPSWIEHAAAHLLQRSYSEPHWQAKSGQVAAFEKVTLFGVTLVPRRRVNYGPINPAEAREVFLRSALTTGDFDTRAPFWRHNRELIEYVRQLESKVRRRDILVDEESIYAFYAERVPAGIYSKPQFERWLRQVTRQTPKILHMRLSDLMRHEATEVTAQAFPDQLEVGATSLPLEYRFEPGAADDGLTLVVPLPLINQISADRLDWLVPGLLVERITALLRGLPKALRKALVPIPDTAKRLAARLTPSDRPLIQALAEEIRAMTGLYLSEEDWDLSVVPPHLRMKIRLVDEAGRTLEISEDVPALKRRFAAQGAQGFTRILGADPALEREGVTRWTFGDLPESVDLTHAGIRLRGYPSLVDQGKSVAIRVLDSPENAAIAHRSGLRRLISLHLNADIRQLRQQLPDLDRMRLQIATAPQLSPLPLQERDRGAGDPATPKPADLADELIALILDLTFIEDQPPLRAQAVFEQRLAVCRPQLLPTAKMVCQLVATILNEYQTVRQRLADITQVNWMPAVRDMREQLDGLVFRGFLQVIPYVHLKEYPRYLKAIGLRLDRLGHAPDRDRRWMNEMAGIQSRWRERLLAAQSSGRQDPRLDEIRWLLEELRVSLFAQSLGTVCPVSVKRLEARWKELGL